MRLRVLLVSACLPLVLWLVLPLASSGQSTLQQRIDATRARIGKKKGTEHVLSSDIAAWSHRIRVLQGRIGNLQQREAALQSDLDRKRTELVSIQGRLRDERARLARLRAKLVVGQRALAQRLVEMYKADKPDVLTVILNSHGFADLLERGDFIQRIADQDRRIVTAVRDAKRDAKATADRLDALERRQQRVTALVLVRRNEVAQVKGQLIGTRVGFEHTRAGKAAALNKVQADRSSLQAHLDDLEKEQAAVQAKLASLAGTPAGTPVTQGSGQLIWPVNGPITGAFGEQRPGHIHAGIDIAAAEGTPIHAADGGKVVLAGWEGGYGNYTCIAHSASFSTCYAHQSSIGVSVGQSVSKGEVIGAVGNTGHSFGAHLHFETRVNGVPQQPLSYL
jgi:murein DD-endopeptidase MepM/ murein hydrolase activator NlpD